MLGTNGLYARGKTQARIVQRLKRCQAIGLRNARVNAFTHAHRMVRTIDTNRLQALRTRKINIFDVHQKRHIIRDNFAHGLSVFKNALKLIRSGCQQQNSICAFLYVHFCVLNNIFQRRFQLTVAQIIANGKCAELAILGTRRAVEPNLTVNFGFTVTQFFLVLAARPANISRHARIRVNAVQRHHILVGQTVAFQAFLNNVDKCHFFFGKCFH